ncbi:uncharacterized protein [Rutidosis leptorrhynchoides]|uniref:uncharacterized protein isoform X1 n=1 Tax=Rutidosis leptorrhynchoides TaxID=125765 RepID=UPI003A98F304
MTAAVFVSFKVHIRVQDANGTANFVMFDTPVMKLIKKRASEIHDKQQKDGNDDFPDEFSHLVDKNVLFKVEVSSFNTDFDYDVYTVNKVCTDPTTISDFINLIPENHNGDQEIERNPIINIDDSQAEDLENKGSLSYTGDSSTGLDVDSQTQSSPSLKRVSEIEENDGVGDSSCTKKKKFVEVKIEKP